MVTNSNDLLLQGDTVMQEIMEHHSLPQDTDLQPVTTLTEDTAAHQGVDTRDQDHHHQLHHTIHTDDNLNKTINVVNNLLSCLHQTFYYHGWTLKTNFHEIKMS